MDLKAVPAVYVTWPGSTDQKYGPNTASVVALIGQARLLTDNQWDGLAGVWTARRRAMEAARGHAFDVIGAGAPKQSYHAAWTDAYNSVSYRLIKADHVNPFANAVLALTTLPLIGINNYTQDHFDTLYEPWRLVVDPCLGLVDVRATRDDFLALYEEFV
jgi:hypothetical protein